MTGSKVREKRQKKVQIELKCGYHGEGPQLVVSLMPKQVTPMTDADVACHSLPAHWTIVQENSPQARLLLVGVRMPECTVTNTNCLAGGIYSAATPEHVQLLHTRRQALCKAHESPCQPSHPTLSSAGKSDPPYSKCHAPACMSTAPGQCLPHCYSHNFLRNRCCRPLQLV